MGMANNLHVILARGHVSCVTAAVTFDLLHTGYGRLSSHVKRLLVVYIGKQRTILSSLK